MKKISIIMPGPIRYPVGGFKIIYEYAQRLSSLGFEIDIFYPLNLPFIKKNYHRKLFRYLLYKFIKFWEWFDFIKNINIYHKFILMLKKDDLLNYDLIFTTTVETSYLINSFNLEKPVLYFIQAYDNWNLSDDELIKSYKFRHFYNIVISKWLKKILETNDAKVSLYLPNCIDFNVFKITKNPENRNKYSICMIYHTAPWKGSNTGIEALKILKNKYNNLQITFFSTFSRPKNLPSWIKYYKNPNINTIINIYNNHSIFIITSYTEGFGLPPAEAMACGCAVLTTNSGGVLEFCINKKTAIIVNNHDPSEISKNLNLLIVDEKYKNMIAINGNKFIQRFKWDKNIKKIHKFINEIS